MIGIIETKTVPTRGGASGVPAVKFSAVATQDVQAFSVITTTGENADSSNVFHKNIILGITTDIILSGFSGTVVVIGKITNTGWNWTVGDIIYLNGTILSKTPPSTGFRVRMGEAISSVDIDINISESILF